MQRGLMAFDQLVDRFGHLAHQGVRLALKIVALHVRITLRDQHTHDQQRADDQNSINGEVPADRKTAVPHRTP